LNHICQVIHAKTENISNSSGDIKGIFHYHDDLVCLDYHKTPFWEAEQQTVLEAGRLLLRLSPMSSLKGTNSVIGAPSS
jgi:hypothetical protein